MTLYIPAHFDQPDRAAALELMAVHPFALLVSHGTEPVLSHVPLRVSEQQPLCLEGHLARANPAAAAVEAKARFTAVFTGPHAYVSPTWYVTPGLVPTWNYAAVHATGDAWPVTDRGELAELVDSLADVYERHREAPWIPDYESTMLDAIIGFRLPVAVLEAKFKLSQNRSAADRQAVVAALDNEGPGARAVAEMMRR